MSIDCPFKFPVPEGTITYPVPERLRERIAALQSRRGNSRNVPKTPIGEKEVWSWHRESKDVFEGFESVENELRALSEVNRQTHVEYFANWRYRCVDHHTLHAEYLMRVAEAKLRGGP